MSDRRGGYRTTIAETHAIGELETVMGEMAMVVVNAGKAARGVLDEVVAARGIEMEELSGVTDKRDDGSRRDNRPRDRDDDRRDYERDDRGRNDDDRGSSRRDEGRGSRDDRDKDKDSRQRKPGVDDSSARPPNGPPPPEPDAPPPPDSNVDGEIEEGEDMEEDEMQMMAAMGFGGFDTTKGKTVSGNQQGAANVKKQRTWRQYMNRKGGFNRPLDKVK
ncbi:hypothetical protein FRC11_005096 [Ceratobasidium sp. 423]|nr:hypothetical protein FRC11_005096 [Ceratobasidium sp. 423]